MIDDSIALFSQIDLQKATSAITSEIDYLTKLSTGEVSDGEGTDESNIVYALQSFNSWSDYTQPSSLQKN
jgi:hypothetical protein